MGLDIFFYKKRISDGQKHQYSFECINYTNEETAKEEPIKFTLEALTREEAREKAEEKILEMVSNYNEKDYYLHFSRGEEMYDEFEEIGYFRKVNFLMGVFDEEQTDTVIPIDNFKHKLNRLKIDIEFCLDKLFTLVPDSKDADLSSYRCSESLEKAISENEELKEVCEDTLPTQMGFFFGSYEYNYDYFYCLKKVLDWIEEVLPSIDEENYEYHFEGNY